MKSDSSSIPVGFRVVDEIKLPMHWRRYFRRVDRIKQKYPGARSFPSGMSTLYAIPRRSFLNESNARPLS
jgi:hypothetical protein